MDRKKENNFGANIYGCKPGKADMRTEMIFQNATSNFKRLNTISHIKREYI